MQAVNQAGEVTSTNLLQIASGVVCKLATSQLFAEEISNQGGDHFTELRVFRIGNLVISCRVFQPSLYFAPIIEFHCAFHLLSQQLAYCTIVQSRSTRWLIQFFFPFSFCFLFFLEEANIMFITFVSPPPTLTN